MPKSPAVKPNFELLETFWREPVQRTVLPNGLTLLVRPDHSAAVASVQVWVKTGSIHEQARMGSGVSHYLEHMLFKGTARRAGRELSATIQAHGGYINAYTTFDRTVYYIDLPSEHAALAIDILADMVLHSTLAPDEVRKERDVILREIDMGRDDPDQRLGELLFGTAYREHPFRYPIIGHKDVFSSLTRDDLWSYYKERYVPNNLVVVVAGSVDPVTVQAEVEKHFASAPRARLAPVVVPAEPAQLAARTAHRFEDVEITRVYLAWPIPGIAHADAPLLDLLSMVLGYGDSSILWQELREQKKLVHSIDAQSWTPGESGLFYVSFTCDPPKRDRAIAAVEAALARCARRAFSPAQLNKVLRQMVVSEIRSRKTISGQASRLGSAEVVVGDIGFARSYFDRLRTIKNAELQRAAALYFRADRRTLVTLNPRSAATAEATVASAKTAEISFEQIALPNGARILHHADSRLPNLHLRVLCQGGALFENAAQRGATTLLSTLLTKDTQRRTAAEVARTIEEVGGGFSPFSGNNTFGFALEVLPTDTARALDLLEQALLGPTFDADTFATERDAQRADLQQDADDVVTFTRKSIRQKFFGSHPLAIEPSGTLEGLAALKPAALAALWKKYRVASNIVVAVAGDFDPKKLLPALKKILARLPKGTLASPDLPVTQAAQIGSFTEHQPREQAVVMQAYPGPSLRAPDYYVSEVADELFSGMSSRLFERVRDEKGLAYYVRSTRVVGLQAGMFGFYAGTNPATDRAVLDEIDAEIARVAAGAVEPAELARCQTRLKAGRRMSLQTNASRAMQAGLNAICGQPLDEWVRYDSFIDTVTIKDLQMFARLYLRPELRTELIVKA